MYKENTRFEANGILEDLENSGVFVYVYTYTENGYFRFAKK